jgi:hypothetical protein
MLGAEPQDIELALVSQRVSGLPSNEAPSAPFEVDDEFVLGWRLHQQVGRLAALEDESTWPTARRHTSANSKLVKPVRSPPGRARFGTKPLPSGSVNCTPLAAWSTACVAARAPASCWQRSRRVQRRPPRPPRRASGRDRRSPSDNRCKGGGYRPSPRLAQSLLKGSDPIRISGSSRANGINTPTRCIVRRSAAPSPRAATPSQRRRAA